ncbi:MAG: hypothetical protein AB1344_01240 [Pseudomonadota bacterium]
MSLTHDILEQAPLGAHTRIVLSWPDNLAAPAPGQCLQLDDDARLWPMREARAGRLETLAKAAISATTVTPLALAGHPVEPIESDLLILAEGLGLAPLIHLCEQLRGGPESLLATYETTHSLPFRPRPSRFMVGGLPVGVIAAIPLLEDWAIPSRLACPEGMPGCFEGGLDEMLAGLSTPATVIAFGDATFLARIKAAWPQAITRET